MNILSVSLIFFLFLNLQIALQGTYIVLESLYAAWRYAADGARALALEGLLNLDVSRRRQFVYLYAEVSGRGSRLLLYVRKFGLLNAY